MRKLTHCMSHLISIVDPYLLSFSIELNSKLFEYASEVCLGACTILSQSIHSTSWISKAFSHNVAMINSEERKLFLLQLWRKRYHLCHFLFQTMVSYVTGLLLVCLYQIGYLLSFSSLWCVNRTLTDITAFNGIFKDIILNQNCSFEFHHNHLCT